MPIVTLRRLTVLALSGVLVAALGIGWHRSSAAAATLADSWSSIGTFRTPDGWYASPMHAAMMTDGRVMFVGIARPNDPPVNQLPFRRVAWIFTPPAPGSPIPAETTIAELNQPVEVDAKVQGDYLMNDDLECMGAVHAADGSLITAGGSRTMFPLKNQGAVVFGLPYLTTFTSGPGASTGWTRTKQMIGVGPGKTRGRWYPTLTRLPSGKILITGGLEQINFQLTQGVAGVGNKSIETYDPVTGGQTLMVREQDAPEDIHASDYTHVFVLPSASGSKDLLMIGENGKPVYAKSTEPNSLVVFDRRRPGGDDMVNYGTSTVQLPFRVNNSEWGYANGSVLTVGGNMHTRYEHQADLFDPSTATWAGNSIELDANRHHPSTVLLPDGRLLVVNGHDMMGGRGAERAQYIDPRRQMAVTTGSASMGVIRGYHSVALLLPDGRVLVGGGRDQDRLSSLEKPNYQIYTPTYPSGPQPTLVGAPQQVGYGSLFQVSSTGPVPQELVLLGLGSMTHSIDMGQREIQLSIGKTYTNAGGASLSIVGAPANGHVAPPGYYWLYGVSATGVPSTAKLIKIG